MRRMVLAVLTGILNVAAPGVEAPSVAALGVEVPGVEVPGVEAPSTASASGTVSGTPAPDVASAITAVKPSAVCRLSDRRLIGLSGLAVTRAGYALISDSNSDKARIRIFYLDKKCRYVKSIRYPTPAYDPEDLAVGRDGALYVADIGDNGATRSSIAVWKLAPGSTKPRLFRYAYPDRAHDAEAMLLAADDTPVFVTKDIGVGRVYVPAGAADPSGKPVRLKQVGSFTPSAGFTPNGLGLAGGLLITGGANSPDRTKVALRTYSTLYEWRTPDGDVVKALTTTAPTVTPLPNEPQGESVAYSLDGTHVYTVSDQEVEPVKTKIFEYASGLPAIAQGPSSDAKAGRPAGAGAGRPASVAPAADTAGLTPNRRLALVIAAGTVVVLLLLGGVAVGLARRRGVTGAAPRRRGR